MSSLLRQPEQGSILTRKLMPDMSQYNFQQDGAPAHTAKRAQEWCNTNLVEFWHKSQWPGNSPDLNQIENLWSIVKQEIELMDTPTSITILEKHLKAGVVSNFTRNFGEFSIRDQCSR